MTRIPLSHVRALYYTSVHTVYLILINFHLLNIFKKVFPSLVTRECINSYVCQIIDPSNVRVFV